MEWFKFYARQWLFGSSRAMTPDKRGVWVDLLSLASETKFRDGTLRHEVGEPMTREYIAAVLKVDRHLLDVCLIAFQADYNLTDGQARIAVWDDGTIEITNWGRYQEKAVKAEKPASPQKPGRGAGGKRHKRCPNCEYKGLTSEQYCPKCQTALKTDYTAGRYGHMVNQYYMSKDRPQQKGVSRRQEIP